MKPQLQVPNSSPYCKKFKMSLDLHCHAQFFAHTRWCQTHSDTLKQKEITSHDKTYTGNYKPYIQMMDCVSYNIKQIYFPHKPSL